MVREGRSDLIRKKSFHLIRQAEESENSFVKTDAGLCRVKPSHTEDSRDVNTCDIANNYQPSNTTNNNNNSDDATPNVISPKSNKISNPLQSLLPL